VSASFSPAGSRLVTAGNDGTVRVLDARPVNRAFRPRELAPPPRPVAGDVPGPRLLRRNRSGPALW